MGLLGASLSGGAGAFDLLETQVLASSASSVTFSSLDTLAAGYQHLQIRAVARSTRTEVNAGIFMLLNGVTTASYSRHGLVGDGSSVSSFGVSAQTLMNSTPIPAANATASAFGGMVLDILDPFETTKNTTARALGGVASNYNELQLSSSAYYNTAAVSSVTLYTINDFATGSRFSLYGIKAA